MKAQDLKNSILQLAIQGRLVAQDANDEPAEVLYAKIQAEKQKLIKEGKIKKDKPLPPITDDEIPFEIPSTWKWVRLGDIGDWGAGATPNRSNSKYYDGNIPWLKTGDLNDGLITDIPETISELAVKETSAKLKPIGSVLMAMYGATIGKLGILGIEATTNQACCACIPMSGVYNKYVFYYLLSQRKNFIQQGAGGAQPNISREKIIPTLFPLPPLVEQKRIVAKIEKLEPLVKQYDKAETELSALNGSFPEQLKKSILQYAIQGKLVAQDANDEPAEVLCAKIQAKKQRLIKEGKIKKDKPLPPITDDEVPFAIPSTWKWVRLKDICSQITDGEHTTPKRVDKSLIPLLTAKNIRSGYITYDNVDYVDENTAKKCWERCNPRINDIFMTCVGYIGRMSILKEQRSFVIVRSVALIRSLKIYVDYLKYALEAPFSQMQMAIETKQTAQPCLYLNKINEIIIPLPPLAEQHRIVAKVNELMQYCEELGHPEKRKNVEPITIGWLIDKGFASCQQNGYTDVNAILDELSIAVMQDRNLKKGRIEYDNNKKKFQIWVKDLNDNWTKTHELVHYVNDNNEIKLYGAVGRKDETSLSKSKERNVDVLTAEILMPEDIFVSAVEQDNIRKYAFVDNAIVRKLSKQFRVSDDAVKIRLQNLGYHTK